MRAFAAFVLLAACTKREPPPPAIEKPPPAPSVTTPPVWQPPEPSAAVSSPPPPSPDLVKARAAAETKDWKKVRSFVEKKARAGKASTEEAQLAFDACFALKDKACFDAVHAKYPDVINH